MPAAPRPRRPGTTVSTPSRIVVVAAVHDNLIHFDGLVQVVDSLPPSCRSTPHRAAHSVFDAAGDQAAIETVLRVR